MIHFPFDLVNQSSWERNLEFHSDDCRPVPIYVTHSTLERKMRTPKAKNNWYFLLRLWKTFESRSLLLLQLHYSNTSHVLFVNRTFLIFLQSMCRQVESPLKNQGSALVGNRSYIILKFIIRSLSCVGIFIAAIAGIFLLVTRSPLHLVYDRLDPAGPGSVYVQGECKSE